MIHVMQYLGERAKTFSMIARNGEMYTRRNFFDIARAFLRDSIQNASYLGTERRAFIFLFLRSSHVRSSPGASVRRNDFRGARGRNIFSNIRESFAVAVFDVINYSGIGNRSIRAYFIEKAIGHRGTMFAEGLLRRHFLSRVEYRDRESWSVSETCQKFVSTIVCTRLYHGAPFRPGFSTNTIFSNENKKKKKKK